MPRTYSAGNEEVIEAWYTGVGRTKNKGGNLFWQEKRCELRVLYSYGTWYPLAMLTEEGFVVNSKRYSNTTSRHQSQVKMYLDKRGVSYTEKEL